MIIHSSPHTQIRDKSVSEAGGGCVDGAALSSQSLREIFPDILSRHRSPRPPALLQKTQAPAHAGEPSCESGFWLSRWVCRASRYLNKYPALEISSHRTTGIQMGPWGKDQHYPFRHSWSYRVAKRIFDLLLAVALLPFLLPVCVLLMLLIKCSSKGPIFYKHLRVGQDSRGFYLYKFRTMFLHGDALLEAYLATTPEARQEWDEHYKLRWDPRVTPLGVILRRTSLDELPQIVNVLLGHMSFVGPRPIVHDEIHRYGAAFPFYAAAKPGITGLWQVSGRGNLSYETRVSLDILYVTTWSFFDDLRVLLKTARAVCNAVGAY
jgi:exopolysaccharide production protein ExoY